MKTQWMRVLLGEDSDASDGSLRKVLEVRDAELIRCGNGIDAVRKAFLRKPDVIVLDVNLPRMNGYQCARLLKQDPSMKTVPIIHLGPYGTSLDRFWSQVCRGDTYLTTPVDADTWEAVIHEMDVKRRPARHLVSQGNVIAQMDDQGILMMVTGLLEQDLLRATVLNEINRIDTWDVEPRHLATSLLTIIHSIYPFSRGAALLISDDHGKLYACGHGLSGQGEIDEIENLMIRYLWEQHSVLLNAEDITSRILEIPLQESRRDENAEIYVHTRESGPVYSALFFENMNMADLNKDEQEILFLALDLVHGVLEKKIFARKSQELSIMDMATKGYSMTFFMEVLQREMSNARRNQYRITLITVMIANFADITKDLRTEDEIRLIRIIQNAIMRTLRKTDFIARWKRANFVFLLTHTPYENAKTPMLRVQKNIQDDVQARMPSIGRLIARIGMSELDPERDQTPESFFDDAMPGKSSEDKNDPGSAGPDTGAYDIAPEQVKMNERSN